MSKAIHRTRDRAHSRHTKRSCKTRTGVSHLRMVHSWTDHGHILGSKVRVSRFCAKLDRQVGTRGKGAKLCIIAGTSLCRPKVLREYKSVSVDRYTSLSPSTHGLGTARDARPRPVLMARLVLVGMSAKALQSTGRATNVVRHAGQGCADVVQGGELCRYCFCKGCF